VVVRPISADFLSKLRANCLGEPIHYIGLGAHDFQFAYGEFNVRSENRVTFKIGGVGYDWTESPIGAPVWNLIEQKVVGVEARSTEALKFVLSTGDEIETWTDDSSYEAVIVEAKSLGIMEVF
jgi:hypothetical protein